MPGEDERDVVAGLAKLGQNLLRVGRIRRQPNVVVATVALDELRLDAREDVRVVLDGDQDGECHRESLCG